MSGIVLSAGVRQNLLSLQGTADLMSQTQNRLATGKKVNTALDSPSNYFTSQSLNDRATDLNALLDAIGQGQKILEAANQGITSLTKLVQSAKATAQQARQSPKPVTTYAPVSQNVDITAAANLNGSEVIAQASSDDFGGNTVSYAAAARTIASAATPFSETLGQLTGSGAGGFAGGGGSLGVGNGGNIVVTANGTNYTVPVLDADDITAVITKLNTALDTGGGAGLIHADNNGGQIRLTALSSTVDFSINGGLSTAGTLTATQLGTTAGSGTSTSLLDSVGNGQALTFAMINGTTTDTKTVTIGTGGPGANQVQTLAELSTWINANLGALGGTHTLAVANTPPATAVTGTLNLVLASGATNSVTISGSTGFSNALKAGGLVGTVNSMPTFLDLGNNQGYDFTNGGNLTISVNGSLQTVGLAAGDRLTDIINKLRANATLDANLTFADDGSGHLQVTAKNTDVDFAISPNTVSDALGLTADAATLNNKPSTSLLDLLNCKLNGIPPVGNPATTLANGATLTLAVNGGTAQTITFGTGTGQVSTFADLQTSLSGLVGINASLSGTTLNLQVPSDTSQTSLTVSGSNSGAIATALGLTLGTQSGAASPTSDNATRTALQSDYNTILVQIDNLVKDASYNGINLIFGDDLKIIFNESGQSSLTITGVRFDASGLGLSAVNGSSGLGFQDDATVDTTISRVDAALSALRSQASKFGSNLTTVQTRQDFTKNLITTLQVGADQLVLADTNEEGANMLALQTRQQLSTTALSLSAQADQAVLRLFG